MDPGADEHVGRGLRRGVGAVGRIGRGLSEGGIVGRERAVDLVGGDVEEAEGGARGCVQRGKVRARGFEEVEGAVDVGLEEGVGAEDGAVDVALGGEVDYGARLMLRAERLTEPVQDEVAADESGAAGDEDGVFHCARCAKKASMQGYNSAANPHLEKPRCGAPAFRASTRVGAAEVWASGWRR